MNILDAGARRNVSYCNFNEHTDAAHPDRVMPEHDLIYMRDGSWSIGQDAERYAVGPGDAILLHAGHHHFGTEPCRGTVRTLYIHFSASAGDRVEPDSKPENSAEPDSKSENSAEPDSKSENLAEPDSKPESLCGSPENARRARCIFPTVVRGVGSAAENLFRQVIYAHWSDDPLADVKASAYLDLLLCELGRTGAPSAGDTAVDELLRIIKNNPAKFYTVGELAAELGYSEKTVSEKFKSATGQTPHAYQLRLKCRMADELLLLDPELSLKKVAEMFGFCDEYHFSRRYKSEFGHAPRS